MARSMSDVSIMLDVIAAPDSYDNLTFKALGRYPESGYLEQVRSTADLRGMKLGLPWNPYWSTAGVYFTQCPLEVELQLTQGR